MAIAFADSEQVMAALEFPVLVEQLRTAFASNTMQVPLRHHHDYANPAEGVDSTLLLMPAWQPGRSLGVKIISVSPNNARHELPAIHGLYLLFDAHSGEPLMVMDAAALTVRRTAAASALASTYLSREDSTTLLMVGTGALAPHLVCAHAAVRPIGRVLVWGRNMARAQALCDGLAGEPFELHVMQSIEEGMAQADIVSTATLSQHALVCGRFLRPGQHIDLVGSFKKDMREADDELISSVALFVDSLQGATQEPGDIVLPLQSGVITLDSIRADLFQLTAHQQPGRTSPDQITCFKSVGHALEDLVAAQLVQASNAP